MDDHVVCEYVFWNNFRNAVSWVLSESHVVCFLLISSGIWWPPDLVLESIGWYSAGIRLVFGWTKKGGIRG